MGQTRELIMADENARQTEAQPASVMAVQLKVNFAKMKTIKAVEPQMPDAATIEAARKDAEEFREKQRRIYEADMAAFRDTEEKVRKVVAKLSEQTRDSAEFLVASETHQEAGARKSARRRALSRQREGGALLPHEKELIVSLKPEGPETNKIMRCFNRASNAWSIRKLYRQDLISLLAEKKAAAERQYGVPLHVTSQRVKSVPEESMARALSLRV